MAGGGRLLVYCSINLESWWCHDRILSGRYCRQDRHRTGRSLYISVVYAVANIVDVGIIIEMEYETAYTYGHL